MIKVQRGQPNIRAAASTIPGRARKKLLTPGSRRTAVTWAIENKSYSQRRACGRVGMERRVYRCRPSRPDDAGLRKRLRELAAERRRFGYRRLHLLLKREGVAVNLEEALSPLSRGAADGTQVRRSQAGLGHQGAAGDTAGRQPALELRLRLRHADRWSPLPDPVRHRRPQPGVSGPGRRQLDLG